MATRIQMLAAHVAHSHSTAAFASAPAHTNSLPHSHTAVSHTRDVRTGSLGGTADERTSASTPSSGTVPRPDHALQGYTVVITGASRGIGLALGVACARAGACVCIWAKTEAADPRLPGTIYTAKAEIEAAARAAGHGEGRAEAVACDIRSEVAVDAAVERTIVRFGGIDILINNASAISLTPTDSTAMKKYDLMHQVNARGTFMVTAKCLPYLRAAVRCGRAAHVLNISPPLDMSPKWFAPHVAYTMAKYGMSLCTLGMAEEFRDYGIAVNSLWPRTAIATAAVQNLLGGHEAVRRSRTTAIMADSGILVLTSPSSCTGNFFIDEYVLYAVAGIRDFSKYNVDPAIPQEDLDLDFFLPPEYIKSAAESAAGATASE